MVGQSLQLLLQLRNLVLVLFHFILQCYLLLFSSCGAASIRRWRASPIVCHFFLLLFRFSLLHPLSVLRHLLVFLFLISLVSKLCFGSIHPLGILGHLWFGSFTRCSALRGRAGCCRCIIGDRCGNTSECTTLDQARALLTACARTALGTVVTRLTVPKSAIPVAIAITRCTTRQGFSATLVFVRFSCTTWLTATSLSPTASI
mmetsp:Transcript_70546/g.131987  ORF Transcript_70546/g.131987 Transcript_70546/m.131987 type:complete len:203 (-) Transcript_70546:578-1186(-)